MNTEEIVQISAKNINNSRNNFEQKKTDIMHIFFASDNNFTLPLTNAISSILRNANEEDALFFHILDKDISQKHKNKIDCLKKIKNFQIEYIKVDDKLFAECPLTKECSHIPIQTYYRYLIPQIRPNLDKVLYLDCDILIVSSLQSLWNVDLLDTYCGVVEEMYEKTQNDARRLGVKSFFNAGVLLINNKKWVKERIDIQLFENTKKLYKSNNLIWQDQDVLNNTFKDNVTWLNPKYNLQQHCHDNYTYTQYSPTDIIEAKKNTVIIHYNTDVKPWSKGYKCSFRKDEYISEMLKNRYYKKYFVYLIRSIFNKRMLRNIFSMSNVYKHNNIKFKQIKIFGIKIRFKAPKSLFNKIREIIREEVSYTCAREVYSALCVQNLHTKVFPQFRNIHNNQSIAIFGCGPSFQYYNNDLKNTINIALNKNLFLNSFKADYFFALDGEMRNVEELFFEKLKNYHCKKFIGYFLEPTRNHQFHELTKEEGEDIYHFYSANRIGLPAQSFEEKIYTDITNYPLADFYSVAFPALHFAFFTNPQKIYLIGMDTSNNGHFFYKNKNACANYGFNKMLEGYKLFKSFQINHYPNTEIISVNPVGLKGLFRDVYTKNFVEEHPELRNEDIEIINEKGL